MKRKQQIRELIEHHDKAEDDDDDFFSSTPMRTNKHAKVRTMLKKIRNEFACDILSIFECVISV